MTNETKPYHLLVVEDNPGDYRLLEQYDTRSQLISGRCNLRERSPGVDRATKYISLTTCAAQPILKQ